MTLPEPGERVLIRWPSGPHDFVIQFEDVPAGWPDPSPGWVRLRGLVIEPGGPGLRMQSFEVRPIGDREYTLRGSAPGTGSASQGWVVHNAAQSLHFDVHKRSR